MTATKAPKLPALSEKAFMQQVRDLARTLGYLEYHPYDSRKSTPGFPDCVFVHGTSGRLLFRELKTAKGKVTSAQETWLEALGRGGADVGVWRPADLVSGRITREFRS